MGDAFGYLRASRVLQALVVCGFGCQGLSGQGQTREALAGEDLLLPVGGHGVVDDTGFLYP